MAFSSAVSGTTVFGNLKVVYGTYTGGGTTGGDVATGLTKVLAFNATAGGSSVVADAPTVNETLPCGGTVTIIVTNNTDGTWVAYGK